MIELFFTRQLHLAARKASWHKIAVFALQTMELILRIRINYGFLNKLFLILYTCVIFDIFKGFLMNFR